MTENQVTEVQETKPASPTGVEPPVSLVSILKENTFLTKMIVFFFLMLFVPLFIAWKFDLFLVAN